MRFLDLFFFLVTSLITIVLLNVVDFASNSSNSGCVSFAEAGKHLGTNQCIRGTVLRVETGAKGTKILNFCAEKTCPFTVVVFPADVKKMGDIHQLEGRQIEIKGTVQDYDGRAEIILRRSQQLGEAAFHLFPTVPTDYDVERKGHGSAGSSKRPKAAKTTTPKQGAPVSIEDPGEPQ
jgi:DNA/RNA endonuclease YhcR with UshA esterase domain